MRGILVGSLVLFATAVPGISKVQSSTPQPDHLSIRRVPLPGEGRGDYLLADPARNRLFVTHTHLVHILDLKTVKPIAQVSGLQAAHGVALDNKGRGYVTDGKRNCVVVFDPETGREIKRIPVGAGPDSILFDPASSKIMAFDGESKDVSVIDPDTLSVVATIKLPNGPEYSQADGKGHVYVNLEEGNAIAVIASSKLTLDHLIPLKGCDGPAPLAFDHADRLLFSGCGNHVMVVANADTGKLVATVPIGGEPDGIAYDPGMKRIFVANRSGGWTIVRQANATRYEVAGKLKIEEYAKTLAFDPRTHRLFSSSADLIWPPVVPGKKHLPDAKPGTFRLLVVSQR